MCRKRKSSYLAAYDCGTGGLWGYLWARSPGKIVERYSKLMIVQTTPPWMTVNRSERLEERSTYDIDELPVGMMLAVVDDRSHS